MAELRQVVDGKVEITKQAVVSVTTLDRREVVGKIAEVQTKIDHATIDITALHAEKADWVTVLEELDATPIER